MNRINVSMPDQAHANLQAMYDAINERRLAQGLDRLPMRFVIAACVDRVAAMETAFLCGYLLSHEDMNK